MHLDKYGLPIQADGDRNDQLHRVGMCEAGYYLGGGPRLISFNPAMAALTERCQPKPGVYTRYPYGDPDNCSADQLISVLCAWVAMGNQRQIRRLFAQMCLRLGFAQNFKDGLDGTSRTKVPDFMAIRALPLFVRASAILYPIALVTDLLLVLGALAAVGPVWRDDAGFARRAPDDVDDNNIIMTLAVCRWRMPTPWSWLATRVYAKWRPWNLGCMVMGNIPAPDFYHPIVGALRWYHRAEAGGNPELADLWTPIVERYLL